MKKIKHSIIGLLLALIALFTVSIVGLLIAPQATQTASAASINDLTFTAASDGSGYWVKAANKNLSGNLDIPSSYNGKPVTTIGYNAFNNCTQLISVTIPDSITSLKAEIFSGCTNLSSIKFGNGITKTYSDSFNGCSALHSVVLPDSLTEIGERTFVNCGLTTLVVPNSVKKIGRNAFLSCNSLTTISFMGTRAEWDAISKSSAAILDAVVVECLDVDL